jgi:hypothetical protein
MIINLAHVSATGHGNRCAADDYKRNAFGIEPLNELNISAVRDDVWYWH